MGIFKIRGVGELVLLEVELVRHEASQLHIQTCTAGFIDNNKRETGALRETQRLLAWELHATSWSGRDGPSGSW